MTRLPIIINAYNPAGVSLIVDRVSSQLRPGDQVALVNGNGGHRLDETALQLWVSRLVPSLPPGVSVSHHTSGLSNVQLSAASSPPVFSSLLYDYEPNFEPEFTWDFSATASSFRRFAAACRAGHRKAVGYPTGRPILEPDLSPYRWDYGELRACVDQLIVQTQHWARVGFAGWGTALSALETQFSNRGWSVGEVIPQVSIGSGPNAVDAASARLILDDAQRRGVGGIYIWWSPDAVEDLVGLLE